MRFATIRKETQTLPVVLDDGVARPLASPSLLAALREGTDPDSWETNGELELGNTPLAPPVDPPKVVAIGLNYQDHIRETGMDAPASPLVFAKFPSCVTGPRDPVRLPAVAPDRVDWEVELAVVIGRQLSDATEAEALDAVFGYTVGNDLSARDVQFDDVQWTRGKSFDTFCPLGPVIVTPDELGDPQGLALRTRINDVTVQDSNTAEMIFSVAELLSYCSRSFPLEPGDVVMTGTPWGCGEWSDPQRWLRAGDVMEAEIEGIGTLRNEVVAAPEHSEDGQ